MTNADLFLRMEFKWIAVFLVGTLFLCFVVWTRNFSFPNKHVPPPHRMLRFVPKEQVRKSFSGTVKLSEKKTQVNLSFPLSGGWNNVSQDKTIWKPSHLTPAAFRDWVHWEPGLKFHQPCKHTKIYPCCHYGPGHTARKLHIASNSSNVSIEALVKEFYQKAQNKKLLFVGNSLTLYFFDCVTDLIHHGPVHLIPVPGQDSGQSVRIQTFTNPTWKFSATNIYHYVMADSVCEKDKRYSLSWKMLQQYFQQSDVILFNIGFHYSFENCPKQITMKTLNRVAAMLQSELAKKPQKQVIFRSTPPQHFAGNDGYHAAAQVPQYKQVGCQKLTTRREHETNDLLKFVAEKYKFKYMDSFPIYMDRWDLHWKPKTAMDCSHNCIIAEVAVPELALLNSILD